MTSILMIKKRRFCDQTAGFTLIEIAMVLGIMGLIASTIWILAANVNLANQTRTGVQQLLAISQNIRTIFAEKGGVVETSASFPGTSLTQALDQLKAFPLNMRQNSSVPAGIVFHAWSSTIDATTGLGSVQVNADDCSGAGYQTSTGLTPEPCFDVTLLAVPKNACIQLLLQASQDNLGLQRIFLYNHITGVSSVAGDDYGNGLPLPVSMTRAIEVCNNSNGTGNNDITWVYRVRETKS